MSEQAERMCVLLPCAGDSYWAVPQCCLAEILTLPAGEELAPGWVNWRGVDIPVLDFGEGEIQPRREGGNNTGLIAVILGLEGAGPDYWGVALRGPGLAVREIACADCHDRPDAIHEYALAAFELDGKIYQVPDLPALQGRASRLDTAVTAQVI